MFKENAVSFEEINLLKISVLRNCFNDFIRNILGPTWLSNEQKICFFFFFFFQFNNVNFVFYFIAHLEMFFLIFSLAIVLNERNNNIEKND